MRARLLPLLASCAAGALAVAGFAPIGFWPLTLASLAVLFVPSFFVLLQRFEEWLIARKKARAKVAAAE